MTPVPAGCPLAPRQFEMLGRLANGETYKQIAQALDVSGATVRTTLHNIYVKLGVVDRAQAVILATQVGWLDDIDTGDWADRRTTPAQGLYLDAFDALLLGEAGARRFKETGIAKCDPPHSQRTPNETAFATARMAHHFHSLFMEARKPLPDMAAPGRRGPRSLIAGDDEKMAA